MWWQASNFRIERAACNRKKGNMRNFVACHHFCRASTLLPQAATPTDFDFQEFTDCGPTLEIREESSHRYTGPSEHPCPTDLGKSLGTIVRGISADHITFIYKRSI